MQGKEQNKAGLRMPVRLGNTRKTMGQPYIGNTGTALQPTLSAPKRVVKTPQGLKLVPAKRNILGQCSANSQSCIVREKVPRKLPKQIFNTGANALMVANTKQHLSKPSEPGPLTSSPLVPLEEYEKHQQGSTNIGIFEDFKKFRTLPEAATSKIPCLQFGAPIAKGKPEKLKSNPTFKPYQNYASGITGAKTVSEMSHQKSISRQTLISIPNSPRIVMYSKDTLKTSTFTPAANTKERGDLSSKISVLPTLSVNKAYTTNLNHNNDESALKPPDSTFMHLNKTLTIEQKCDNDKNKLSHLGDWMRHDEQLKVNSSITGNAQTCSSFQPKLLEDCTRIESQTNSCSLQSMHSCVYPVLEMEQKHLSLLQKQHDLEKQQVNLQNQQADIQKQLSGIQQKQSDCLKKMMELQQEKITYLQGQSAMSTQVRADLVHEDISIAPMPTITVGPQVIPDIVHEVIPIAPMPKVIGVEPSVSNRRRSARLSIKFRSEEESLSIETTNSVPDTTDSDTQCSLTKDRPTGSSKKALKIARNSGSIQKKEKRRKSVVLDYGGLRSAFKDLLQTPKETPCADTNKSLRKVQFSVQDTPARISSNVMKQLNTLYDS